MALWHPPSYLKMSLYRPFIFCLSLIIPPVFLIYFFATLREYHEEQKLFLYFLQHCFTSLRVFMVLSQIPSELSFLNRIETEDGGGQSALLLVQASPEGSCSFSRAVE